MAIVEQQPTATVEVIRAAERVLESEFGDGIRLDEGHRIPSKAGTEVYRLHVAEGQGRAPASVIVKRIVSTDKEAYDPNAGEGLSVGLFNAWSSAQFLSMPHIAGAELLTPACYGGDRGAGLIVMQDVGTHGRLDQLLLASDPVSATAGLEGLARTIGRIHACTIGRQQEFDHLRRALGPRRYERGVYTDGTLQAFRATIEALALSPREDANADVQTLMAALNTPGPFEALTHGDVCPDNCMRVNNQVVLLDFEGGSFGPALIDGVFAHMLFPTCFCVGRLATDRVEHIEAIYRAELMKGCRAASDDNLFRRAVLEACAYWTLSLCEWLPMTTLLEHDWTGGERDTGTARQRVIARFEIVARLAMQYGYLQVLGDSLGAMAARLRALWPAEADALPVYPAFRGSTRAASPSGSTGSP